MRTVSADEVQHHLPSLLERLQTGESMVIERDGEAVATLSPPPKPKTALPASMRIGLLEGQGSVPENWKELGREEIELEFYGEE